MLLTLRCPAKINLFLAVGQKDARNYHPLRTIFQAIDICDTIRIGPGRGRHEVLFDDPSIPTDNTVTRTLRLLSEVINLPPLLIAIEKHIPPESGLGGGSSNAAAIIRAAQRIAKVTIPMGELNGIAEAIGMDVPFFLVGGRARGEGYGEKVTALPDTDLKWIVVARPQVGSGTPQAYRRLDETAYEWRAFPQTDELYNDFEKVAPQQSLELMRQLKLANADDVALSGSGSAVFGRFKSMEAAIEAKKTLLNIGAPRVWVTRTLSRTESLAVA